MPRKKTKKRAEKEDKFEKNINQIEGNMQVIENDRKIQKKKEAIKQDLQNQLKIQNKIGKQFDDMIDDYLYFVELKERLQHDIDTQGIRYKSTGGNGFTTYKPNESCERLLKTNAQMLKILQDLDLKSPDDTPKEGEGDDLL